MRKKAFLNALSLHGNVLEACEISKTGRSLAYQWREKDQDFAAAWLEAIEIGADRLELHIHERIRDAEKPSDVLAIFMLKGLRPEKYRENYSFTGDLNVTGGLTLSADIDGQIEARAAELAEAKRRLESERLALPADPVVQPPDS
jgi:hypothetical protein